MEFAAQVVNNGPTVGAAAVVITLPVGLALESDEDDPVNRYEDWWSIDSDDDGTPLDCTSSVDGLTVTCATGSIPAGANFLIAVDLMAEDDAVTGTSGTLGVTLQSTPSPGDFPTTSVQATVDFVGTAHLQVHLTPSKATIVVGQSLTFVATVHNVGPNTAVEAAGIGLVLSGGVSLDQSFTITNSAPFPGADSGSGTNSGAGFALHALPARTASTRTATSRIVTSRIAKSRIAASTIATSKVAPSKAAAVTTPSGIGYWPIGTIAPGATASVEVVVKADSIGQAELDFDASSADESCEDGTDPDCENTATADLDAVAPATTTASTTAATTSATTPATTSASALRTSASLPNTGFHAAPWLTWAAAVIVLGVGLIMIGSPRRRGHGRHR